MRNYSYICDSIKKMSQSIDFNGDTMSLCSMNYLLVIDHYLMD